MHETSFIVTFADVRAEIAKSSANQILRINFKYGQKRLHVRFEPETIFNQQGQMFHEFATALLHCQTPRKTRLNF